uniref:guanylate cyclase n=1 Tax=Timema bartmani TaxID=61472 RepID=A0A7R9I508_9NEOP|nr:unnamed protein product [Timema bartmani]
MNVRDVTNENTVRFVGACIECPIVLILTEYSPKGSLKDVLQNDELKLDWNFRMSLIHDVVKGMAYLHSSEVMVHGKLRSCNCLIDGRFVLKISDFGLKTLTTPSEIIKDNGIVGSCRDKDMDFCFETPRRSDPSTVPGDDYEANGEEANTDNEFSPFPLHNRV